MVLYILSLLMWLVIATEQTYLPLNHPECDLTTFNNDPTLIEVPMQGKLRGRCNQVAVNDPYIKNRTENVMSWLGIPYAEAPVGNLRFKSPRAHRGWSSTLNATQLPNICIQKKSDNNRGLISEDCLYLNIYAPLRHDSDSLLPVFVYIHGGLFTMGSGSALDANYVVGVASKMIAVTLNYRLGPFGYMYLRELNITGNMGFLDQHLALKWIHENIKLFGGDPNRVTVSGRSAGSFSINYHLIYKPSWPFFRNAIMQSGTNFYSKMAFMPLSLASNRADSLFKLLNCSQTNLDERLNCVESLDPFDILNTSDEYHMKKVLVGNRYASQLNPMFHMVQNGIDFNESIIDSFSQPGHFKSDLNLINGYNQDEGGYFIKDDFYGSATRKRPASYALNHTSYVRYIDQFFQYYPTYPQLAAPGFKEELAQTYASENNSGDYLPSLSQLLGEHSYICSSIDFTSFYSEQNQSVSVYRYSYDHWSKADGGRSKKLGVMHGAEKTIWGGESLSPANNHTDEERRFTLQVLKYWTNFVKHSDPNINDDNDLKSLVTNPTWPKWVRKPSDVPISSVPHTKPAYQSFLSLKPGSVRVKYTNVYKNCQFWRPFSNYPETRSA